MTYLWGRLDDEDPPPRTNRGGKELPISVRSEPIEGYRIWRVVSTSEGMALKSLNHPTVWNVENTAECLRGPGAVMPIALPMPPPSPHAESPPGKDCSCGFYIMLPDQPLEEWSSIVYGRVHASGTVALTGRVIRCTMGYKAEHVEILSPVVLDVGCASSKDCENPVVKVDLQVNYARGWCADHVPEQGVLVEARLFFREACRQLSERYPNIEFISWI